MCNELYLAGPISAVLYLLQVLTVYENGNGWGLLAAVSEPWCGLSCQWKTLLLASY